MIPERRSASILVQTTLTLALSVLLVSAATAGPPAHAGPPHAGPALEGGGTGMIMNIEIEVLRETGGNSHQARTITGVVEGTLTGEFVQDVTGTVKRNGDVTFGGVMQFTGTIEGCGNAVHSVTLGLSGKGVGGPAPVTESTVRVIRNAANSLHATGHGIVSQEGPFLTYTLSYRCR